jgi:hypothetical protein
MPTDYTGPNKDKKPKADPSEKVVEKIVTVEVIQKKKTIGKKFKDIFFGGDFKSVAKYVAADVLLPALRNMVADTGKSAIDRAIYGEGGRRRPPSGPSGYGYRPYTEYSTSPFSTRYGSGTINYGHIPDQPRRSYYHDPRDRRDDTQIIIVDRREAETIIEQLINIIEKFDVATVADFKEMCGLQILNTDQKWGWTSPSRFELRQTNQGWLIDLPPADPI